MRVRALRVAGTHLYARLLGGDGPDQVTDMPRQSVIRLMPRVGS
jgi:hypothetical protein